MVSATEQRKRNLEFIMVQCKYGDLTEQEVTLNTAIDRGLTEEKVAEYIDLLKRGGRITVSDEELSHLKLVKAGP